MDYLRSCYSTKFRVFSDSVDTIDVDWYFCKPSAVPLGVPHSFGSLNWGYPDAPSGKVGEVPGEPRPWRNGAPTRCFLGLANGNTDDEWRDGVEVSDDRTEEMLCCKPTIWDDADESDGTDLAGVVPVISPGSPWADVDSRPLHYSGRQIAIKNLTTFQRGAASIDLGSAPARIEALWDIGTLGSASGSFPSLRIFVRGDGTANYISAGLHGPDNTLKIWKQAGSTQTVLASTSLTMTAGTRRRVILEDDGSALTVSCQGVSLSYTTSDYLGETECGIDMRANSTLNIVAIDDLLCYIPG